MGRNAGERFDMAFTSGTQERRKALRKLLVDGRGQTQEELVELLKSKGFATSQSTVSRDLKLIGALRRIRDDGALVYGFSTASIRERFPSEMVASIEQNESLVVVRTRIGRAPAVGVEVDALHHPEILACIAGDDAVLVVPRSIRNTKRVAALLRELAELPPT
jgi:transcriptional regulator of arginine metabolism